MYIYLTNSDIILVEKTSRSTIKIIENIFIIKNQLRDVLLINKQ